MLVYGTKYKIYKYGTLIGCSLILLCDAIPLYWGNLSIYVASYLREQHGVRVKVMSAWTISIFLLAWDIPAFAVTFPTKKFGKRWTMLIGIALTEVGFLLGWLSVLYPDLPVDIGYGLFCGLGTCFTYTVGLLFVMDWSPDNTGLASGCFQAAFALGGVITNQAVSYCINPSNEESVQEGDYVPFFKERTVNESVPRFLVYNIIVTLAISLIGFVLINDKSSMKNLEMGEDRIILKDSETLALPYNAEDPGTPDETVSEKNDSFFTPIELLKSKTFCALSCTIALASIVSVISLTYYKSFGQANGFDDLFLTLIGTTSAIVTVVGRGVFGAALDHYGIQTPMIAICAVISISSALIYFTPDVSKWLYFLCVQIYASGGSILHSCSITALIMVFGSYKFPMKLTMLLIMPDVAIICIPPFFELLILSCGWFGVFALSAAMGLVVVIMMILWLH